MDEAQAQPAKRVGDFAAPCPTADYLRSMVGMAMIYWREDRAACVRRGRKFIGIERDPIYHAIACSRIREEVESCALFSAQNQPKTSPQLFP